MTNGPRPTISVGGVETLQAPANLPAVSARSSLCLDTIGRSSSTRSPGPNEPGNVTDTVSGSMTLISRRFPRTRKESAIALAGSYAAASENTTSSADSGEPSENFTFGFSLMTYCKPSWDRVQLSASHGSTSSVARLTRISLAWVSRVTRYVVASGLTQLQNDRGSDRTETVRAPPLSAAAPVDGAFEDRCGALQALTAARAPMNRTARSVR